VNVAVVGGGIIGLSVAWRLAQRDVDVTVFDAGAAGSDLHAAGFDAGGIGSDPGLFGHRVAGAWQVAAGMLAPGGESAWEHDALRRLLDESAGRWPSFAAALGVDVGYDEAGTVSVALTADDLASAAREWTRRQLPLLRPSELRDHEPALSPRIRAGVFAPGERQVDPRRVVAALRDRLAERVVPKRIESLDDVDAETVIVAAGCGTAALTGLPVRPVKGQVLRLRGEPGLLRHVVDGTVDGRGVYLVPRADGEIVVGATQEERTDHTVTAGGVYDLLRAALDVVPGLAEHELAEASVGHRPGTPDNAPLLGRLDDRVVVAAGHHRNGVLLAPVTADLIADLVLTGTADPLLASFDPGRFRCS
jgi:glycine oxidase